MADKIQPTGKITDELFILNFGFVCMYLFKAASSYIGFDTGMKMESVRREMAKLGIDPAMVKDVVLTHSDTDHVGGLGAFPDARIYLPKDEVAMIDKTTARFFGFIYNKPLTGSYQTLEDEESVSIAGASIRCLATPGHTAGHMSYLVNGSILIAGDILNIRGGKIVMDRKLINIDNTKRKLSIQRIAALRDVSHLCTMHSGFTNDFEAAVKEWK